MKNRGAALTAATYRTYCEKRWRPSSTVRATAAAVKMSLSRQLAESRALLAEGVHTLEIKVGLRLELEAERKMLRVAADPAESFH